MTNPAIRYRVYTEDKNRGMIKRVFNNHFNCYTFYSAHGIWQGKAEKSLCIEVVGDERDLQILVAISEDIKYHNNQMTVLLTKELIEEVYV